MQADSAIIHQVREQPRQRHINRWMWGIWILFVPASAALRAGQPQPDGLSPFPAWQQVLLYPVMLLPVWAGLHWQRPRIQAFLRRLPLPPLLIFTVVGAILGALVAAQWSVCFDHCGSDPKNTGITGVDLDPDPVIKALLYVGPFGGTMLGWYLLRRWYAFDYRHVFWVEGMHGAFLEQGNLVPMFLLAGNPLFAAILFVYLVPVYGTCMASVFVALPDELLPRGTRQPKLLGYTLCITVPWIAFYAVAAVWYVILGALNITHVL